MKTSFPVAGRPGQGNLARFLRDALAPLAAFVRRRKARRQHLGQLESLLELEDHLLRDMGMTRPDVRARAAALRRTF